MTVPIPDFIRRRITPDGWIKRDALINIHAAVHQERYNGEPLTPAQDAEVWRQALDIASEMVATATAGEEQKAA